MRGKMEIEILWILACDYEFPNGHSNRNDGIYVGSSLLGEADVSFGMWVLTDPSPFFRLKKNGLVTNKIDASRNFGWV